MPTWQKSQGPYLEPLFCLIVFKGIIHFLQSLNYVEVLWQINLILPNLDHMTF